MPQDWQNAILVPVPKKENLLSCDNWRGIAFLNVVGKSLGRIVQNRLQRGWLRRCFLSHGVGSGRVTAVQI